MNRNQSNASNLGDTSKRKNIYSYCLDICPICGENICEHTNVAEKLYLPNSISQDFSTYSSDSSLIKQLFSDAPFQYGYENGYTIPNSRHGRNQTSQRPSKTNENTLINNYFNTIHTFCAHRTKSLKRSPTYLSHKANEGVLTEKQILLNDGNPAAEFKSNAWNERSPAVSNYYFKCKNSDHLLIRSPIYANPGAIDQNRYSNVLISNSTDFKLDDMLRPVSCQVMLIDKETTDELLREFFDSVSYPKKVLSVKSKKESASGKAATESNNSQKKPDLPLPESKQAQRKKNAGEKKLKCLRAIRDSDNSSPPPASISMCRPNCVSLVSTTKESAPSVSSKKAKHRFPIFPSLFSHDKTLFDADNSRKTPSPVPTDFKSPSTTSLDDSAGFTKSSSNPLSYLESNSSYGEHLKSLEPLERTVESSNASSRPRAAGFTSSGLGSVYRNSSSKSRSFNLNSKLIYEDMIDDSYLDELLSGKCPIVAIDEHEMSNENFLNDLANSSVEQSRRKAESREELDPLTSSNEILTRSRLLGLSLNARFNKCCLTSSPFVSTAGVMAPNLDAKEPDSGIEEARGEFSADPKLASSPKTMQQGGQEAREKSRASTSSGSSARRPTSRTNTKPAVFRCISSPQYHSLAVILILFFLFVISFCQECFLLYYYYQNENKNWLLYSLVALVMGQLMRLIISCSIDLDPLAEKRTPARSSWTSFSDGRRRHGSLASGAKSQNSIKCFRTFCWLVESLANLLTYLPGFLPLRAFVYFFIHFVKFRRGSGSTRFYHEFKLAICLFFNAIFHSLPLSVINTFYIMSSISSYSYAWYYAELLSPVALYSSSSPTPTPPFAATEFWFASPALAASSFTTLNLESRNKLIVLTVSVFISVSIGICLFSTYYELMRQINSLGDLFDRRRPKRAAASASSLKSSPLVSLYSFSSDVPNNGDEQHQRTVDDKDKAAEYQKLTSKSRCRRANRECSIHASTVETTTVNKLGHAEALVFFCYRFCNVLTRLNCIALIWFLFREWLIIFLILNTLFNYVLIYFMVRDDEKPTTTSRPRAKSAGTEGSSRERTPSSLKNEAAKSDAKKASCFFLQRLFGRSSQAKKAGSDQCGGLRKEKEFAFKRELGVFVLSLVSFVDLFLNPTRQLSHFKKVFSYYTIQFLQNFTILNYWLLKTILVFKQLQSSQRDAALSRTSAAEASTSTASFETESRDFDASFEEMFMESSREEAGSAEGVNYFVGSETASATTSASVTFSVTNFVVIVYVSFILLIFFSLFLKFLHLFMVRRRTRPQSRRHYV